MITNEIEEEGKEEDVSDEIRLKKTVANQCIVVKNSISDNRTNCGLHR